MSEHFLNDKSIELHPEDVVTAVKAGLDAFPADLWRLLKIIVKDREKHESI